MKFPSVQWLLIVFIVFSLNIHNLTLLPTIQSDSVQISLVIATVIMNLIVFVYYPFRAINNDKKTKKK